MQKSKRTFDNVVDFPCHLARPRTSIAPAPLTPERSKALAQLRAAASLVDAAGRSMAGQVPQDRLDHLVALSIELSLQEMSLRDRKPDWD